MADAALTLTDARLPDGRLLDIDIAGGVVAALRPPGGPPASGADALDCRGGLVSPSFVEGHIHLDKTLLGLPYVPHRPGATVAERIANEKALRRTLASPVEERGGALIERIARFGTGALRSHVDIDTDLKLDNLHAVLRLRERYRDLVDIEIVAFPQSGILRDPGTADLLDAALREGADLVGGLDPAGIDDDVEAHLDIVFALAERRGAGVDIHLHDPGALGAFELRRIAGRTRSAGLQGRVAVSHAYCLGALDDADFGRTAEALAGAGVAVMTNAPGTGPMPPVRRLAAAGVAVFTGSDNIRDAWWPYGDGDMLDRAMMIGYRQGFHTDADLGHAFAMATSITAGVLRLDGYALEPGGRADLVLIPSPSVMQAVLDRPPARTTIKRGRIVARDGLLEGR